MVITRAPIYNNEGTIGYFDYAGCLYPQGQTGYNNGFGCRYFMGGATSAATGSFFVPPVGTAVGAIAGVVIGAAGDSVGIADVNNDGKKAW